MFKEKCVPRMTTNEWNCGLILFVKESFFFCLKKIYLSFVIIQFNNCYVSQIISLKTKSYKVLPAVDGKPIWKSKTKMYGKGISRQCPYK